MRWGARKTGYSRSTVAHAESGRQHPDPGLLDTADELLQADDALLAGYQRVHAAKQDHEQRRRKAELAEAYASAQALRATTSTDLTQDVSGLAGQDALASVAAAAGAVLAEGLAGPLVYLAFLSSAEQPVSAAWGDQLSSRGPSPRQAEWMPRSSITLRRFSSIVNGKKMPSGHRRYWTLFLPSDSWSVPC